VWPAAVGKIEWHDRFTPSSDCVVTRAIFESSGRQLAYIDFDNNGEFSSDAVQYSSSHEPQEA
jgi:hypothetical protein